MDGRPKGEPQDVASNPLTLSHDGLGSARCRARATFVSAKVAKTIARGHNGFGNFLLPQLPSVLAERRPRRTPTSM